MTRQILPKTHAALRTACTPVADGYPLTSLFDELERAMKFPAGIGLAAPQIGETVRALVVCVPHGRSNVKHRIANPEIYFASKASKQDWEGCLSFETGYRAMVLRPEAIKVRGLDENFQPVHFGGKGLLARCLLHEIDHLDGVLMTDNAVRVDDRSRRQPSKRSKGMDIGI